MTDGIFEESDPVHAKALGMLQNDLIAWIVTIAEDGSPRAVPVWFFWNDGTLTILCEPDSHKVERIRGGSPVLVHLHAGGSFGDDVVVLRGPVTVTDGGASDWLRRFREPYAAKYAAAIEDYGMPIDAIAEKFSVTIEMTPENVLAW